MDERDLQFQDLLANNCNPYSGCIGNGQWMASVGPNYWKSVV